MILEHVDGLYFDRKQATKIPTQLLIDDTGCASLTNKLGKPVRFSSIHISDRIGDSTRFLTLPNHELFETDNNDAIDRLLSRYGSSVKNTTIETKYVFRVVALALVLFSSWSFIHYGIPAASYKVAMMTPVDMLIEEGQSALKRLDEHHFSASSIEDKRQIEITEKFKNLLPENQQQYAYQLHFRAAEKIGANAFALPSGDILVTDALINLAQNDDEIISILLHEIAHVELRHSVQSVVQTSTLLLGVVILTGDITSLSTILFAIPALLLDTGYSRRMEEQADSYSLEHMTKLNIDPIHFANIMLNISDSHKKIAQSESSYWSSHPPTNERIGKFKVASQNFRKKVELINTAE